MEIRCLPTNIPNHIEVDVSALDIGDSIHVEDIQLPEGIRTLSDPHLTLVAVVPPLEEKPAAEEPAAGAEVEVATKKGKGKAEAEG